MKVEIREISDAGLKSEYAERILLKLPEWFGIPESTREYVDTVADTPFFAAFVNAGCVGFISGKTHYGITGDIYVTGVDPDFHGRGIGRALYMELEAHFRKAGCSRVIVKTLSERSGNEPYGRTRAFYRSVGFENLITLTEMWSELNPCLIMVKDL